MLKLASGDPLSEIEKDLLEKAVQDVESMSDKWWFVAARYMELKRGKEQAREMGKVGVRKWWGVVKEERAGKGNTGKVKGEKVKYEEE